MGERLAGLAGGWPCAPAARLAGGAVRGGGPEEQPEVGRAGSQGNSLAGGRDALLRRPLRTQPHHSAVPQRRTAPVRDST
ncbi:unnamed protein product [Urochloa humidicola]